jgi:hypothetical protein
MIEQKFRETSNDGNSDIAVFCDLTEDSLREDRRTHERSIVIQCLETLINRENLEISNEKSGAQSIVGITEIPN